MKDAPYRKKDTPNGVSSQEKITTFGVFFERMEMMRISNGLSNADVARQLGISNQSFQKYRTDRIPSSEYLYRISHVLGVSMNWLLGDGDLSHPAYLKDSPNTVDKAEHEAIKKALNLISQANNILTDYISE